MSLIRTEPRNRKGHATPAKPQRKTFPVAPRRRGVGNKRILNFRVRVVVSMIYFKLLLTAFFWGGTFIAGKMIAGDVGPYSAAFLRFAVASVLLLLLLWRKEGGLPAFKKEQVISLGLLGLTGAFAYNVFFLKGLQLIDAGRASVIIANNPIFIALFSAFIFKERLTWTKVAGIVLSVAGAVVVISRGSLSVLTSGDIGWGELFILGCVASWVSYSLIGKAVMKALSPLATVTYSCVAGAAFLLIPAYLEGVTREVFRFSGTDWLGILYLGVFGTVVGFVWFYEGMREIGPTKAGQFINFVPVSAIVLAFFILREPVTFSLWVGALLVVCGVYLTHVNVSIKKRTEKTSNFRAAGSRSF
jgi:drug/metabolite transporter (DMT)-like permease